MSNAIRQVCGARKRHVDAYARIQKSYKALVKAIGDDTRLDSATVVTSLQAMVKACIDHKSAVTTGGHNILIDVIPNDIVARCLDLGRAMLDEETSWLTTSPEKEREACQKCAQKRLPASGQTKGCRGVRLVGLLYCQATQSRKL